eukprot:TRINITY_DN3161_c0_g1_i1.p1 TRINITY_DN3161_c0_g1~~TRINITY_DN3161_c0_g1_i1.p1  ORF type:complete len:599 (+),score=60.86 TRINITY_DN3161_c0_g1_i1:41-1837(+)
MGQESEKTSLLPQKADSPVTWKQKLQGLATKENAFKAFLLVFVIIIGAVNRITFKIMQYSTSNYSYFISQWTTFVYIPVNFAVIFFKLVFTNHITKDQMQFPKYKFAVMGALDSLQGLLIVVGGSKVPGVMQNLLMQGVVPVTMLFSIVMLRNRGCSICKETRALLSKEKVNFIEKSTQPEQCSESTCFCSVSVGERTFDPQQVRELASMEKLRQMLGSGQIQLFTSAKPWALHLKTYYSVAQYIGAVIILSGLLVSVWPALSGGGSGNSQAGPPLWDMVFFLATVPTAISAVYKQIAFESVDLDVWYLNGWVALFQFIIGLAYAPLAAVMSGLAVTDIPINIWQGLRCFLTGMNFIFPGGAVACSTAKDCLNTVCCDSCNGMFPDVTSVAALWGVIMYMGANIIYNVMLIMVIKHFDAAMMYVASTVVLPLGAACFTVAAFMGSHAMPFTTYDGAGLGVVLLGLIVYRFLGRRASGTPLPATGGLMAEPALIEHSPAVTNIHPRTARQVRSNLYSRLGIRPGTTGSTRPVVATRPTPGISTSVVEPPSSRSVSNAVVMPARLSPDKHAGSVNSFSTSYDRSEPRSQQELRARSRDDD